MYFLTYIFSLISYIATKIQIPIPVSQDKIIYLNVFTIFFGFVIIGIVVYFYSKFFNTEVNWLFSTVTRKQTEELNSLNSKKTKKIGKNERGK